MARPELFVSAACGHVITSATVVSSHWCPTCDPDWDGEPRQDWRQLYVRIDAQ